MLFGKKRQEGFYHVKYDGEWTIGKYISYTLYRQKTSHWIILNEDFNVSESEIEEIDENQIIRKKHEKNLKFRKLKQLNNLAIFLLRKITKD